MGKNHSEIHEIHVNLLSQIIYFLINLFCFVQEKVSNLLTFSFIRPIFYFFKKNKKSEITLDHDKPIQKIFIFILRFLYICVSNINGLRKDQKMFEKLLLWDRGIPIKGYISDDKYDYWVNILLGYSDDGIRGCDASWFTIHKPNGRFYILSKQVDDKKSFISCLWVTGKNSGKPFIINNPKDYVKKDPISPDAIYYPPEIVIFIFHLVISITSFSAFIAAIMFLLEFYKKNLN